MANVIDDIVKKQALDSVDQLIAKVTAADAALLKTIESSRQFNASVSGVKTPASLSSAVQDNSKLTAEIQRQAQAIGVLESQLKSLTAARATATRATSGQTSATREQSIANQILRNETDRNYRANTLLAGAYARASARLLILKKEAKDYAIALGEESAQAKKAAAAASELDGRIKSADATVGDFQRNVGNYSNGLVTGFQKVFSSVRQLAYILPGIGIGGIFALALEPLYDLIKGLGIFNDKFLELKKNFDDFRESQTKLRQESRSAIQEFALLYKIANDATALPKERELAARKLKEEYKSFFDEFTTGQIKAGKAESAIKRLNEALNAKVGVETQTDYKNKTEERIDLINDELKARREFALESAKLQKVIDLNTSAGGGGGSVIGTSSVVLSAEGVAAKVALNDLKLKRNEQLKFLKDKKEENLIALSDISLQTVLAGLQARKGLSESAIYEYKKKSLALDKEANKEAAKAKDRPNIQKVDIIAKPNETGDSLLYYLQAFQKELEQEQAIVSKSTKEWDQYQKAIDRVKESIKGLTDAYTSLKTGAKEAEADFNRKVNGLKNLAKAMDELNDKTKAYLGTFSTGFLEESGFGSLTKFFDHTFSQMIYGAENAREKFQVAFSAITEAGQEAFNFLSKYSKENFDAELERVERQKNITIAFAGESEAAKVDAALEAEKQTRKIKEREASAEKRLRLFNAIIDTAQAVVAALPNIPLSIIVGLIGAAQIAAISATQIPAFWQGGLHAGGALKVNDDPRGVKGGNYKEVIKTPSGSVIRPQGKDVTTSAPIGSFVFPTYEAYEQHLRDLDGVLHNTGINPTRAVSGYAAMAGVNSLTPEQYFNGVSRTEAAIRNFSPIHISEDRRGKVIHNAGQQGRTQTMNNRLHVTGKLNP